MNLNRWSLYANVLVLAVFFACSPSEGSIGVNGGLTRQSDVEPGGSYEGVIVIRNTDDKPVDVKVFQTDYTFTASGVTTYGEPGKSDRSNASWISFIPHQVTIPARDIASVYYTVNVPKKTDLSGTYWSVLMVEPVDAQQVTLPKGKQTKVNVGIRVVSRYAVQVVTNIGDTGVRDVKMSDARIAVCLNDPSIEFDLENTGERWLDPTVWIDLYDSKGASLGRKECNRMRLYPGCSGRYRADLGELPKGEYQAMMIADNGDENVFGSQIKIEIK